MLLGHNFIKIEMSVHFFEQKFVPFVMQIVI